MGRMALLTPDQLQAKGIDAAPFLEHFAELPGSVATLAHRPEILNATLSLWNAVMTPGAVALDLKYLAGYLASMAAGCRYCAAHTASNAAASGGGSERIAAVWDFERSPLFSDAERTALRFAMLAGQSPSGVTDEAYTELAAHYDDGQIVELLAAIALYGFFNRWNDSLAMPLEATPRGFAETHLTPHGWEIGRHD
jgi:alkylhydroperoxidase family enzyme